MLSAVTGAHALPILRASWVAFSFSLKNFTPAEHRKMLGLLDLAVVNVLFASSSNNF